MFPANGKGIDSVFVNKNHSPLVSKKDLTAASFPVGPVWDPHFYLEWGRHDNESQRYGIGRQDVSNAPAKICLSCNKGQRVLSGEKSS